MTPAAQLALLSKLDGTASPPRTVFIFTCNGTGTLESAFLSRCHRIIFNSDGLEGELSSYLAAIWRAEGGRRDAPDFRRLARESRNVVRDALLKLEVELMIRRKIEEP